jgi:hypothetical protein
MKNKIRKLWHISSSFKDSSSLISFVLREYLKMVAFFYALIGLALLLKDDWWSESIYGAAAEVLPLDVWGIMFTGSALLAALAVLRRSGHLARQANIVATAISATWGMMVFLSFLNGYTVGPSAPVAWFIATSTNMLFSIIPSDAIERYRRGD